MFPFLGLFAAVSPICAAPLNKRDIAKLHVKRWELVEVRSRTGESSSAGEFCGLKKNPQLFLDFRTNGEVYGSMCCNSLSGKYDVSLGSNDIIIHDLSMTMLGCLPEPKLEDSVVLSQIDGMYRIDIADSELSLFSAVGDSIWRYKAQSSEVSPITNDGSGQKTAK